MVAPRTGYFPIFPSDHDSPFLRRASRSLAPGGSGCKKNRLAAGQEVFGAAARDFLNDLAWWKASSGGGAERGGERAFFGMTGMFSGGMY